MEKSKKSWVIRSYEWGRGAFATLAEHRYSTIAGTLVFFLILSIVPFLFWLSLLFGSAGIPMEEIAELELFGWVKDLLGFFKKNAEGATAGASILFLVTTLWSSSGFFYHLRRSGEIIYGSNRAKHGWRVRVSAFAITFCVLLYFAVAGTVLIGGIIVSKFLNPWVGYPVVYTLVLVAGFFAAWILNGYICPYRVSPSDTVWGSFITSVAWLVASGIFAVYLNFSNKERLYGALSLVVVFLVWLYWMMLCFVAGVIFNRCRLQNRPMEHKKL